MMKLLPSVLRELWQTVDEGQLTSEQYQCEKERLLDECRSIWSQALILDGERSLKQSLLRELGASGPPLKGGTSKYTTKVSAAAWRRVTAYLSIKRGSSLGTHRL